MALGLCLAFAIPASAAERRVTLEELGSRTKPDHDARLEGQVVTVRGVVNAPAFHFTDYHVLTIQDKSFGGVLKVPVNDKWLDGFHPGDEIEDILVLVRKHNLKVKQIVITHAHIDHVGGAMKLRAATGAPILLNQNDYALLKMLDVQAAWIGVPVGTPMSIPG